MPLKLTRREGSKAWWLTGTVAGQRIRESTGIGERDLAEERRAVREAEIYRAQMHGEPESAKHWSFAEAVAAYFQDRPRSAGTKKRVKRLLTHFGADARCSDLTLRALEEAAGKLLRPDHSPATRLREIVSPARAVLQYAADRDGCADPRLKVKVPAGNRTVWITPRQAAALEDALKPHLRPLLVFLVGTGARLGEAFRLRWEDVSLEHARATLRVTKNGLDRLIDLCPRVVAALAGIDGRAGEVFRNEAGDPYPDTRNEDGGGQIKSPWARGANKAGLPGRWRLNKRSDRPSEAATFVPVHSPHAMRHTWATWHYAINKDLLLLRDEGGWSSTLLVERYAHLAPATMKAAMVAWRSGPEVIQTPASAQLAKIAV